jgi:pimeloyl-ACP methyl ester carboxylesterase
MEVLSRERRVIAPSLPPWHGPPQSLEISHYVTIVDELLAKLSLTKLAIGGNSMGGWIAMDIARIRPRRIESIILEDSAGVSNPSDDQSLLVLNSSGIPVLIIWGINDRIISVDAARYLHSKIKSSSLSILQGAGHVPHWEKPDEFNRLVLDFLRQKKER